MLELKFYDAIGTWFIGVLRLAALRDPGSLGARDGRRLPNFAEIYSLNF
jgi:hypothetical protein